VRLQLIEHDLEDYRLRNDQAIDELLSESYVLKLKKNATKGFLKWVKRKMKREILPKYY
jgi:hypothetical protein